MRKPRTWYCELYNRRYEFCLGWTNKSFDNYIKEKYGDIFDSSNNEGLHCSYVSRKERISVIWVEDKNNLPVIAHECLHAAIRTLASKDIKINAENQEPLTYLFELIFKKAIN